MSLVHDSLLVQLSIMFVHPSNLTLQVPEKVSSPVAPVVYAHIPSERVR